MQLFIFHHLIVLLIALITLSLVPTSCCLSSSESNSEMLMASLHFTRVAKEGQCSLPGPRVVHVHDLYPNARKKFAPKCTILHVCSESTGCCLQENEVCVPKRQQLVTLYFWAVELTVKGEQKKSVEKLLFKNDTECHCISNHMHEHTSQSSGTGRTLESVDSEEGNEDDSRDDEEIEAARSASQTSDQELIRSRFVQRSASAYFKLSSVLQVGLTLLVLVSSFENYY